jgi:uncharacterized RDD family membrane protein YckC
MQAPVVPAPPYAVYGGPPPPAPWPGGNPAASSAGKRFGGLLLESLLFLVTLGIGWLIWSLISWSDGQTPAKSLLGMRCIDTQTGRPATWGTMFVREFIGKSLLGMFSCSLTNLVSCFMILGPQRQGVWDRIASTVVVDDVGR